MCKLPEASAKYTDATKYGSCAFGCAQAAEVSEPDAGVAAVSVRIAVVALALAGTVHRTTAPPDSVRSDQDT